MTWPEEVQLHVAIYNQGVMFKHWAVFIDGPLPVVVDAPGTYGQLRQETRLEDPRESNKFEELIPVCKVRVDDIPRVCSYARRLPRNTSPAWNCQTFVVDLLVKCQEEAILRLEGVDDQRRERFEGRVLRSELATDEATEAEWQERGTKRTLR
ncbi:MAG: hypothetical protein M1832_001035 [Thelocarpon impressellum]|nr:MAG: hypothetical protein M1832_001035 [Thelocarpon impressellum]